MPFDGKNSMIEVRRGSDAKKKLDDGGIYSLPGAMADCPVVAECPTLSGAEGCGPLFAKPGKFVITCVI